MQTKDYRKSLRDVSKISCLLVKNFSSILILFFLSASEVSAGWGMGAPPVGVPDNFDNAILNVTNWVLGFIASIAVLALIWGGVLYTTSAGNESQAENGKNTIKYALIGLVICGLAYALVSVIVVTVL